MRRHAARSVCSFVATLLAANVALVVALDRAPPRWHDPEYGKRLGLLIERRREQPGRPFVVALGSSRVAIGLHPASLPAASSCGPALFNMALVGSGPVMELICFRRLLADGVRPDAVLIEYWPAFLHEAGSYHEAARFDVHRLRPCDERAVCENFPDPARRLRDWHVARALPLRTHRQNVWNQLLPGGLPRSARIDGLWTRIDPWGRLADRDTVGDAERLTLKDVHTDYYRGLFVGYEVSEVADRGLRQLLRECAEAGIPAALLLMPDSPAFAEWVPPDAVRRAADHERQLRADLAVPVIDARGWIAAAHLPDRVHLLTPGAAEFTRRLHGELARVFPQFAGPSGGAR